MDKIYNFRRKKVGSNLDQFNENPDKASDTSTVFPEELRGARHRQADPRKIWYYLELLFSMLVATFNGKYPVPKKTALVITLALLYLVSPIDISPDFLPLIGFADDIAVLAFAFSLIKEDLEKYRAWKTSY
ncbi:YkvA family protein [Methanosarcina sp. T3]|uniref:YkvA family protein n=1 Tax=Methanosarcina sp. T3 TaxID=3439062 RepID=UPI003F8467DB